MPPAALVLVSATWEEGSWVRLAFDRAIDVAGLDGSQITVSDGESTGLQYAATGDATLIAPTAVQIELAIVGPWAEPGVVLDASAATGIVAINDGGAWAGATGLVLPWP